MSATRETRTESASFAEAGAEFAAAVERIAAGARVYARLAYGVLDLWVVMVERDPEKERAVAEAACELMRGHPDLAFDFMVVTEDSHPVLEVAESGYALLTPVHPQAAKHAV